MITDQYKAFAKKYAAETGVMSSLHELDFIFEFLITNPVFGEKEHAVKYYFYDGMNSAKQLAKIIAQLGIEVGDKSSLFEFASGYGCVTRHFENQLPGMNTVSCDIHSQAVKFLQDELGKNAIISNSIPELFQVNDVFNVVFALSFFSHMPRSTWLRWLTALYSRVNQGGVLIFTTQGLKTAREYMGNPQIAEDGFWFLAQSEQKDIDTAEYGQTIVTKNFAEKQIEQLAGAKLVQYEEAFWWGHQDLYVVKKTTD